MGLRNAHGNRCPCRVGLKACRSTSARGEATLDGTLQDAQTAMRRRQSSKRRSATVKRGDSSSPPAPKPKRLKKRVPTHAELIQRVLAGEPYVVPETARRARPQSAPKQVVPEAAKVRARAEGHGKCWSKFGTANADEPSPTHSSIRNWGKKIRTRQASITELSRSIGP